MGELVSIKHTPWAEPWNHHQISVNMDSILRVAGIEEAHVRRRLTAHAILACGWAQKCYNHNVWKCKRGSGWEGDWYVHDTIEEKGGVEYVEQGTGWRAYSSYAAALDDYRVWHLQRYAAAKAALIDGDRPDRDFAQALKDGGYFTGEKGVDLLTSICGRVKKELAAATPEEMAAADEATALNAALDAGADDTRPFPLLLVCAGLAVVIGAVLVFVGAVRMKGRSS